MKRPLQWVVIAAGSQLCIGAANVVQKDPRAIPDFVDAGLNFMGQNVCLSVHRVALRGIDSSRVPSPTIRMEMGLDVAEPTYTIVLGAFGTISIREGLERTDACANLPLADFAWRNEPGGRRANAEFCLAYRDGTPKIHVRASMQANGTALREDVKSALFGIAECHMKWFGFSDQEQLQLGSYAIAHTSQ